jgi:hypothetical protein
MASDLTEAESIEWIIPSENTMIVLDVEGYDPDDIKEDKENKCYHISKSPVSGADDNFITYKIKSYYN